MAMADLHGIWWMRGVLILTSTGMSRARLPYILMVLSNGRTWHAQVVDSLRRPNGEGCQTSPMKVSETKPLHRG
jgi:hypothetical protein